MSNTPSNDVRLRELELAEKNHELARNIASYKLSREYDLQYLKLTVVIVLLVVIVFYITCKFNAKKVNNTDGFTSPQLSAATNEQTHSNAAHDWYHL